MLFFAAFIPMAISGSYNESDVHSTDAGVQEDLLEVAVKAATTKAPHTKDIQQVVDALKGVSPTDEQSDLVRVAALTELHEPISGDITRVLAASKTPHHRDFAAIYAASPPPKPTLLALAAKMPQGRFVYKLAAVQAKEKAGDKSARSLITHEGLTEGTGEIVAGGIYLIVFVLGFACLGMYVVLFAARAFRWEGHPVEPTNPIQSDQLALRAAQFLGGYLLVGFVMEFAMQSWPTSTSDSVNLARTIVSNGGEAIAAIAVTYLITLIPIEGRLITLRDYGISLSKVGKSLLWAAGGFCAAIPLVVFGGIIGDLFKGFAPRQSHPIDRLLEDPSNIPVLIVVFLTAVVQAPIFEEITFRGTLLPALIGVFPRSPYRYVFAIATSSLLFAALHPQGFSAWIALAMVGVVNCVLTLQTRSVLAAIFMHAMFNTMVLTANLAHR